MINEKNYFDNASTTYVYPEVIKVIENTMKSLYGNPSNLHTAGLEAKTLVNGAKAIIASCLGVNKNTILFTSCASESNALAINQGHHGICSPFEHHDIKENPKMHIVREAEILSPSQPISSVGIWAHQLVNNETGEIFELKDSIAKAQQMNYLTLVDATQALGNIEVNPNVLGADFVSFSLHKCHGPKGIGILYNKDNRPLRPIIYGTQENGYRGGTENVPYIIGGAYAVLLSHQEMKEKYKHCTKLRNIILDTLRKRKIDFIVNEGKDNIPSILNVAFKGVTGESLMLMLDEKGFYTSVGSACNSGDLKPSEVLQAMNVPPEYIEGALRISMSLKNDEQSTYALANTIADIVSECQQ